MGASEAIFPAYGEADWRKAAEAALKGASFDRLVSRSADGFPIEPIYAPAAGPRPLGREGALGGRRAGRSSRFRRSERTGGRGLG